jgi:hypothetical protein
MAILTALLTIVENIPRFGNLGAGILQSSIYFNKFYFKYSTVENWQRAIL